MKAFKISIHTLEWTPKFSILDNFVVFMRAPSRDYILDNLKRIEKKIAYRNYLFMRTLEIHCVSYEPIEAPKQVRVYEAIHVSDYEDMLLGPTKQRFVVKNEKGKYVKRAMP